MISGIGNTTALSQLFSRLDSKGQGYLEKSDFASAFSAIGESDESTIADVFAVLDGDSDGKVTESEFSSTLSQLQQELDSQFTQMRMQGMAGQGPQGMAGGMPPPPPNDEGFTEDELTAQLEEIGDSDSARASLISDIVSNFEAADTDSDGKVSFQEAMAYKNEQSGETDTTAQAQAAALQPPPPPPANDAGFTQDELEAQLEEIGNSDSARAGLISDIVSNFEAADTDGDGKVSFKEAMAYKEEQSGSSTAQQTASDETQVMQRIMQLVQAYGRSDESTASSLLSTLA
ncbi:EF-hand domain-containing protein [Azonexus sp.]|uniref:EF-hand domain-containing protein n=1 Tax=Azonexus sp. TaxID=1872668 RepID=UPI0035AEF196